MRGGTVRVGAGMTTIGLIGSGHIGSTLGRLANEDLYRRCSLARKCFSTAVRKLPVDKPSRADQHDDES